MSKINWHHWKCQKHKLILKQGYRNPDTTDTGKTVQRLISYAIAKSTVTQASNLQWWSSRRKITAHVWTKQTYSTLAWGTLSLMEKWGETQWIKPNTLNADKPCNKCDDESRD